MRRAARLALGLAALLALPLAAQPKTSDLRAETEHVVQPGETLGGIAARAGVAKVLIIEANGLAEPYHLRAGQKLLIPRQKRRTVKAGDTGLGIALEEGVAWSVIASANAIDPKAPVRPGQVLLIPTVIKSTQPTAAPSPGPAPNASPAPAATPSPTPTLPPDTAKPPRFAWPLDGEIRRPFKPRKGKAGWHDGIDLLADKGTAVRAAAAGKVIFAGQGPEDYGLTVIVYHSGRWTTTYSYLDAITVKDGDKVRAGERIGKVGMTGAASEPQLHFEVRRNRIALDPEDYLPIRDDD